MQVQPLEMPALAPQPDVTILTPCYKTKTYHLERLAASIRPVRERIEWVIVDDSPASPAIAAMVAHLRSAGFRIEFACHDVNRGIVAAYCSALAMASGRYFGILDHDDEVDLLPAMEFLARTEVDLVYTDESRFQPGEETIYRKPEFDALSALHYFYMHHMTFFKTELCQALLKNNPPEHIRSAFDIWLSVNYIATIGRTRPITAKHLPYAAYGWRMHAFSTATTLIAKPELDAERVQIAMDACQRAGFMLFATPNRQHPYSWFYTRDQGKTSTIAETGIIAADGSVAPSAELALAPVDVVLPEALVSAYFDQRILVLPKKCIECKGRLADQLARHLPHVPILFDATTEEAAEILSPHAGEMIGLLGNTHRTIDNQVRLLLV